MEQTGDYPDQNYRSKRGFDISLKCQFKFYIYISVIDEIVKQCQTIIEIEFQVISRFPVMKEIV